MGNSKFEKRSHEEQLLFTEESQTKEQTFRGDMTELTKCVPASNILPITLTFS